MNKSSIDPRCLQQVYDSASNAAGKGQAQWFTPTRWGRALASALPSIRPIIVDLTCGNGQLLSAASKRSKLLGCDIQPNLTPDTSHLAPVCADLTLFYPLLKQVGCRTDLTVLNPPWDLHWHRDRLAALADSSLFSVREAFAAHDGRTARSTIDSTVATLSMALDLCSSVGEGLLIANESTLQRLILGKNAPHGTLAIHVWAHLVIDGNICGDDSDSDFKTGVIYFSRDHQIGPQFRGHAATFDECERLCATLGKQRGHYRRGGEAYGWSITRDTDVTWQAAAEEWKRLQGQADHPFNIWLRDDGRIGVYLSLFDGFSGRVCRADADRLKELDGKQPIQLVVQRATRQALQRAIAGDSPWTVDPRLAVAVAAAQQEYELARAPLYPLSPIQRLGYLDEHDRIPCRKSLGPFVRGREYDLRSTTVAVNRIGTRRNIFNALDDVEWNGQELALSIKVDGNEFLFMDGKLRDKTVTINLLQPGTRKIDETAPACVIDFDLQQLADHFVIPEVPDVASLHPDGYQRHLKLLDKIERLVA